MSTKMYRQGDLLLVKVENQEGLNTVKDHRYDGAVIGYGEVTGHKHLVKGALWLQQACETIKDFDEFAQNGGSEPVLIRLEGDSVLTHEEHDTIQLEAGDYRVIRQREYTPERVRYVAD